MTISSNKINENTSFVYRNEKLESVNDYEFKFLGNYISRNGSLSATAKQLAQKAQKVMYSISARTSSISQVPPTLACHLFDSLVRPILTFNSEVWYMDIYRSFYNSDHRAKKNNIKPNYFNFIDKSVTDAVHTKFCKYTLGVKKCASNIASRAELGRYPMDSFVKIQSLLYEDRLKKSETSPILKECYSLTQKLHSEGIYSWYSYVNHVRNDLNVQYAHEKNMPCKSSNKLYYKKELSNHYKGHFHEKLLNLENNSKLQLFKSLKSEYIFENYLHCLNPNYRRNICKFRISDHPLEIEKGRYKKIPRNLRLCNSCNVVEDETHFLLDCSINEKLRADFILTFDFQNCTYSEKVNKILNPETSEQVRLLGSFLKQSLALRTGGS